MPETMKLNSIATLEMNLKSSSRLLLGALSLSLAAMQSSCSTANSGAWNRIQTEGLFPYLAEIQSDRALDEGVTENNSDGSEFLIGEQSLPLIVVGYASGVVTAQEVEGKPGFVYSPHLAEALQVDVRDYEPGMQVLCPYTKKSFVVPGAPETIQLMQPWSEMQLAVNRRTPSYTEPNRVRLMLEENQLMVEPSEIVASEKPEPAVKNIAATGQLDPEPKFTGIPKNGNKIPNASDVLALSKKEIVSLPVGKRVPGKPNYVYSPFAASNQVIDIEGFAPGTEVKCPYTGKVFAVPAEFVAPVEEAPAESGE
jgi:hypothetical protein